jgi:hypothetical protein
LIQFGTGREKYSITGTGIGTLSGVVLVLAVAIERDYICKMSAIYTNKYFRRNQDVSALTQLSNSVIISSQDRLTFLVSTMDLSCSNFGHDLS